MSKFTFWSKNKIIRNLAAWCFAYLGLINLVDGVEDKYSDVLYSLLFLMVPVYINNLKILPFFSQKNKLKGIVLSAVNMIIFTIILGLYLSVYDNTFTWSLFPHIFGIIFFVILFGAIVKIASDSMNKHEQIREAELKLLKAQLNPHFLFNTLNNLYGLAKIKSDKLPNLMLKLSDLLRYSLYDTKEELVPLKKEIQYLENYISLERIRLEDKTQIDLEVIGEDTSILIPPMLLIVFVENAFKHLGTNQKGESKVSITLEFTKKGVSFTCVNSIDKLNTNYNKLEKGKSGIGLDNAKKRLDLMYHNTHELFINTNDLYHTVQLKLTV